MEVLDDAAEGGDCDLAAVEMALLDAGAIESLDVEGGRSVPPGTLAEGWQGFFNGLQQVFGCDFSDGAFVGAVRSLGDAVPAVVIPPGLDGAPCEALRAPVFIAEEHLGDGVVAGGKAIARSVFKSSEDAHFEVVGYTFHKSGRNMPGRSEEVEWSYCVAGDFFPRHDK